ncbi:MAG: AAA family ATPase, partial [Actinobacteria bacterium]|nr:AAA family ATPase [Actinomycetota bacterium]
MDVILASDWEEESEEWLIPSLLCDSLTLLSGEPKAGKTALACHLVRSLVLKTEILGKQPTQKKIKVAWMGFDFKWRREIKARLPDLGKSLYFLSTVDYKATDQWDELEN